MLIFGHNPTLISCYLNKILTRTLILFLFLTPQSAFSVEDTQQNAFQLTSEMMKAMKTLKYQGTLVLAVQCVIGLVIVVVLTIMFNLISFD